MYFIPENAPAHVVIEALVGHWENTPALRPDSAAKEIRQALERSTISDFDQLTELESGTKVFSPSTGHYWDISEAGHPQFATGTGGGYSKATDFWATQGPLTIMVTPTSA